MTPNGITTAAGPLWNDQEQINKDDWEVPDTPINLELVALQTYVNNYKEQRAQKEKAGLEFIQQKVKGLEERLTEELPQDFVDLFTFYIPPEELECRSCFINDFAEGAAFTLWNAMLRDSEIAVWVKLISKAIPNFDLRVKAVFNSYSIRLQDPYSTNFDVQFPKAYYQCIFDNKENINRLPHFVTREYDKRFSKL